MERAEIEEQTTKRRQDKFEYQGIWFPSNTTPTILRQLENFQVRRDDLIVATYPKCGTHWMLEILYLMLVDGHVEKIDRHLEDVHSTLEFGIPPDLNRSFQDVLAKRESPRIYPTHLPVEFIPPQVWTMKPKLIYVTREPKDACSSYYRFLNSDPSGKRVSWNAVFEDFISKRNTYSGWFDHALGYWAHRDDENVEFVIFEDMKKDLRSVIKRLERFLGLSITEGGMERILEHASLEGMKKTYARIEQEHPNGRMHTAHLGLLPFIHQGASGGWEAQFTGEQRATLDQMTEAKLAGTGLDVHYPLKSSKL